MSFDEFFRQGLRDAERRLPMLKPIGPRDRQRIVTIARSSRIFQLIDRALDGVARVCESSMVVGYVRRAWAGVDSGQRRLLVGLGLIVAAAVHVSLVIWQERPPSWLWLIVPGFAIACGVLLIVSGSASTSQLPPSTTQHHPAPPSTSQHPPLERQQHG